MDKPIRLKKYSNRRLYNTETSAYVTLNDLADMIKQGRVVDVVDAGTGADVTAYTLTQILLEEAKQHHFLLPVPLLHLMIRFGESILSDFFDTYLQQMIEGYISYKSTLDEQFKKWISMGTGMTGVTPKTFSELAEKIQSFTAPFQNRPKDQKTDTDKKP